jgi:hypothetical protein
MCIPLLPIRATCYARYPELRETKTDYESVWSILKILTNYDDTNTMDIKTRTLKYGRKKC